MPKLIYHDLKSTQKKTNMKGHNNNNNNNSPESQRPKPAKPQVKSLKYVDLVVRWRKKTADSNKSATENAWDDHDEECIRWRKEEEEEEEEQEKEGACVWEVGAKIEDGWRKKGQQAKGAVGEKACGENKRETAMIREREGWWSEWRMRRR